MNKLALPLIITFCSNALGSMTDRSFTQEKHQNYMKDSVFVFDASVKVLKREYRDIDKFSITDVKRIEKDRLGRNKMDVFTKDIYSIWYSVSFTKPKMIKGAVDQVQGLTWLYSNSGISMCPHYPRGLLINKRYRFYVNKLSKGRVVDIKLLELPQPVKNSN